MQAGDYAYSGIGQVFLREVGAAAAMLPIGNVSKLSFGVSEDVKEQKDYTAIGGGTVAEVRRINSVECSMTLLDLDKGNIARAFLGTAANVAGAAITGEVQIGYKGGLLMLAKPIDTTAAVVVKQGATTYVAGTDYEVQSGGIVVLESGAIVDGTVLSVDYQSLDHATVEGITTNAKEYELYFAGMNEAKGGRPVNVHAYRVKLGPTAALDLLNDDFASFEVKGKLLRDNTKQDAGVSKYFRVQIAGN
jgi:hypothetical protein